MHLKTPTLLPCVLAPARGELERTTPVADARTRADGRRRGAPEERDLRARPGRRDEGGDGLGSDRRRRKKNREEEHWRPERVAGLGEEAYWSGNQKLWTLAVLRRDRVVRVKLAGGPDTQAENLKRATELAGGVLKRL